MKGAWSYLLCAALLLSTVSCLRFVPSREELASDKGGNSVFAGADEFYAHQEQQRSRLDSLVSRRAGRPVDVHA